MKFIGLDIETVPLKIEHEEVREYLMDKRISKEARSLDPNYSKIIMIGIKIMDEPTKIFYGDDEKEILERFWNFMVEFVNKNPFYKIITHNGYKFDIPFIYLRSHMNRIDVPKNIDINTNQWQMKNSNHFDTMIFFSHFGNFTNPNLYVVSKMNGIEIPSDKTSGKDVEKMYIDKEWDKIMKHCQQDIEVMEKLFKKVCLNLFK